MESVMERIMERYGTALVWQHGSAEEVLRGFLQPVTSRSWQTLLREIAPLGEVSRGMYIFLGPVSKPVQSGDGLVLADRHYRVRRTEILYDRGGPAYIWALCAREGGK